MEQLEEVKTYIINCVSFGDEPDLEELCKLLGINPEDHQP